MDSLSRPSVAPSLSLQQQELSVLAEPAVPVPLRSALIGDSPRSALRQALEGIPQADRSERQEFLLSLLEGAGSTEMDWPVDPLLDQLRCEAMSPDGAACLNPEVSGNAALRLVISALLPLATAIVGGVLLLVQIWRWWAGRLGATHRIEPGHGALVVSG